MNTFWSSDHHFLHKNILSFTNRPYKNVDEMTESLIFNHNSVVNESDKVYFLGDFCWDKKPATWTKLLSRMNGEIHFIKGNHDHRKTLKEVKGFASIQDYLEMSVENQRLILFHYPIREWNGWFRGSWHLYGHLHGTKKAEPKSLEVGVDMNNYFPMSFDCIKDKIVI